MEKHTALRFASAIFFFSSGVNRAVDFVRAISANKTCCVFVRDRKFKKAQNMTQFSRYFGSKRCKKLKMTQKTWQSGLFLSCSNYFGLWVKFFGSFLIFCIFCTQNDVKNVS